MAKRKPNQGARKTETLTLRLDPKAKFTIDLLARIRRQSITAVIESAIDDIAFDQDVLFTQWGEKTNYSLGSAVSEAWSTDESERFINLCFFMPELLTYEEQRLWETIQASPCFIAEGESAALPTYWEVGGGSGPIDKSRIARYWSYLMEHVDEHKESRTVVPFDPPF